MFLLPAVTWQSYDSTVDLPGFNLRDFGSGSKNELNWPTHIAGYPAEWHSHLEAIRQSILITKVWAGGDWHQYSAHDVLVLSDEHFMSCSWRDWGGILVSVWNSELRERFTYRDFYMNGRLPERPATWT